MAKGFQYEIQAVDHIEAKFAKGEFGIVPECGKVRRKPAYFSRDRNKDISFDVSIEVTRKGAVSPYLIWVWECKNYTHTVPVDDVEEFHAKLSQIGEDRTKGTMITPNGFDSGTFEFAKSKGIGLWRFVPHGVSISLLEDCRGVACADILRGLTIQDTTMFRYFGPFYGLTTNGRLTTDEDELLPEELGAH